MYVRTSLVLASLLPLVTSYLHFQKKIPNGHLIPFSCKPGKIWPAVGHLNDEGTGTRNCFGRDFEANGYVWNKTLCRQDSDEDGLYNGLEMGDPNCVWVEGATPEMSVGLSHPGICDPPNDEKCANKPIISPHYETQADWMADVCKADGFECEALNDKDIINVTARLPPATPVPAQMTHYICQTFNIYKLGVPRGRDFHIVAVTPKIDNKDVVHHMIVFGCTGYVKENDEPFACKVNPHPSCLEFLYLWTVGMDGECMYPETGTRMGPGGYTTFIIQYHWSNFEVRQDYTDSSGLILHITPNLKRFDAGVFMVGSTFFELPAKEKYITITSTCASGCTKTLLNASIIITAAGNHMHLLGKDMIVEIQRKGHHVAYITWDRIFVYDTPQVHHYPKPLELYPGDTIVTKCGYNTMSRDDVTSFGDGTYDEMCFAFITYHPKQYVTRSSCIDIMGFGMCEDNSFEGCTSLRDFLSSIGRTRVFKEISQVCIQSNSCEKPCLKMIMKHMRIEPCMRGNIWRFIKNELAKARGQGYEFLSRIFPCKAEAEKAIAADPIKN